MVYVVSDLHGCYEKYIKLVDQLDLTASDSLYILGDMVDRGDGGMEILLDIASQKNVFAYRGNHDHYAQLFLKNFAIPNDGNSAEGLLDEYREWLADGGNTTYEGFIKLSKEKQYAVLDYLRKLPLYKELSVGKQKFFLAHTVPSKEKMLCRDNWKIFDFLMGDPEYEKTYFDDTIIVTGHTPTGFIDPDFIGKIWQANNHIAIDCGAVFGNPLGCLCLDTMEEIYVE